MEPLHINGILLDITGVLKEGERAISGSVEAVQRIRRSGIKVRFVTNETQITKRLLIGKLTKLGYEVEESEVFSPCPAIAQIIKDNGLRPFLLIHPNAIEDFDGIDRSDPTCVVIGDAAENFTYGNMNLAFRTLINMKEPCFYTLGRGRYYREDGELVLDVGAFTAALEFATGTKAKVMGKPEPDFFMTALKDMEVSAANAIMIGDDLISDIGGAQNCGIKGILVRTGKYRPSDENNPEIKPYLIADDLSLAVEHIIQNCNKN